MKGAAVTAAAAKDKKKHKRKLSDASAAPEQVPVSAAKPAQAKRKQKGAAAEAPLPDLATALGVSGDAQFEDANVASLFASDKAVRGSWLRVRYLSTDPATRLQVPVARIEPVMPLARARQLTDQDLVNGTLGDAVDDDDEASFARASGRGPLVSHVVAQEPVRKKKKDYPKPDEAVEAEKLHRTIFVGGLPVTNKHRKIAKHFSKYGAVESVRIRSVAFATQVRSCDSLLATVCLTAAASLRRPTVRCARRRTLRASFTRGATRATVMSCLKTPIPSPARWWRMARRISLRGLCCA